MQTGRRNVGSSGQECRWVAAGIFVTLVAASSNPAGFLLEAGAPAYYQARVAVERGDLRSGERVARAFRSGWISQKGYSDDVFPVYLHVIQPAEDPFPASERAKPVEQVRAELAAALAGGGRQVGDNAGR